jgi:phosphoribosylformimino-5-aminoimidazole carboxamide ribotide isomerase
LIVFKDEGGRMKDEEKQEKRADEFVILAAVDLMGGKVVRLEQGEKERRKVFGDDAGAMARRWCMAGAGWLHVVNLDGAFGDGDTANQAALREILEVAGEMGARVEFGGGLRDLAAVERALGMGVERVILGTAAIEDPRILQAAIARWGAERVGAGLDARGGIVRVRGWQASSGRDAIELAQEFHAAGLKWLVYTDIARDGMEGGVNVEATQALAEATGLSVIASGGVRDLDDVRRVRAAGLAGLIVGKALYSGAISPTKLYEKNINR